MDEADVSLAKTMAAEFIRDGLFRLGPTFVKLGQVSLTRAPARPAPAHPTTRPASGLHPACTRPAPALHPPCTRPALALCRPPTHRYTWRLTRRAVRVCLAAVQVVSTREDLLEKEYIDVLKDLQDNVPGFGGE